MEREGFEVSDRLRRLAREGDLGELLEELSDLHASDVADVIESVDSEDRRVAILGSFPPDVASDVLTEMAEGCGTR